MDTSRNRTCSEGNADETDTIGLGCALDVFKEYDEIINLISQLKTVFSDQAQSEKVTERFIYIFNQYQEQPHLLDRYLDDFLSDLLKIARDENSDEKLQYLAFKFLYIITKVRGYKVVLRHLPHEVSDVEPVLALINKQDPYDASTWESRYTLLLWMSIIVMIPFHMHRLDDTTENKPEKKPIMQRIIDIIKLYLSVSDKVRDATAFLAAHFITRPDVKDIYLKEYLDWSLKMLESNQNNISLQAGILSSLALLFKHGKRDDMKAYGAPVMRKILECGFKDSGSSVVRKMALKLIQRIGLSFLRIKVASWRYCRGKRSLADNLAYGDVGGSILSKKEEERQEDEEGEDYDIPEETEDIVEQLLVGLRDKDTIIRWSAAKGIGRVTCRLPKEFADDVVTSVLELFSLRESDSAWHGGCLALAELGRRGLILPQHLDRVVSVVLKALVYDEQRGNFSVGANIRDAACYVCWAFARAYDPTVLQPYVNSIASALLVTTVFDREITCRRAASAAFQENVGRQGTFPHGIEILTETDYYAVGSRHNSFLNLSIHIAQFSEYTASLIRHLLELKVNHWDTAVRELTSKALHNLTSRDPAFMAEKAIPLLQTQAVGIDLNARHGAILSLGEIIYALASMKGSKIIADILGAEVLGKIRSLVFVLDERRLFRGLGGILMRNAVCVLIEKSSASALPFHQDKELIEKWQEMLNSCLQHNDVSVRMSAVSALPHFCLQYIPPASPQCDKMLKTYLEQLQSPNMETRCGYALAVGSLPKFVIDGHVQQCLRHLAVCAEVTEEHSNWAEARRDAVKALSQVATTAGIDPEGDPSSAMNSSNLDLLFEAYLAATKDYTLDSRGEIGAIVREGALQAIQDTVGLVMSTGHPAMLSAEVMEQVMCAIVQQCTEKIDRTRAVAGSVFENMIKSEPRIPHIPHHDELLELFPSDVCDVINWASNADTFHLFVELLNFPVYRYSLLLGFVVSVGGLSESLVKYSSSALVPYLLSHQSDPLLLKSVSESLISILRRNSQNDRIVVPFFKMTNYLLLSDVTFDPQSTFYHDLVSLAWDCSRMSKDPQKVIAAVDLFCNLIPVSETCRKECLNRLVVFLCHRFPRIRKVTANKLYEAFVTYDDEVSDQVTELLCETDWSTLPMDSLRPIRNNLCGLLGLDAPKLKGK